MLFYEKRQILEGIDSIDVLIQPYLSRFIDLSVQLDPFNRISLYFRKAFIPNDNGGAFRFFNYLHIAGEMINPDLNILDTIAKAISMLIERKKLCIWDIWRKEEYPIIPVELIRNNLLLFITGISLVEFCFDFKSKDIQLPEYTNRIDEADKGTLSKSLKYKLRDRKDFIILEDETTAYSNDHDKKYGRKSTLKLYDREKWLLKKRTEYSAYFIRNNPYKKRIEFVLQNRKSPYLNITNFDGNYHEVMERFIPYLAKLYKRYFLNKIFVNPVEYQYFDHIYAMAQQDSIPRSRELKSSNKIRKNGIKLSDLHKLSDFFIKLRKEKKKIEKNIIKLEDIKRIEQMYIKEYPDNYYANLETIPYHTLLDTQNDSIIDKELSDDEFIFFKDSFITQVSIDTINKQHIN
jgi:hypothetical protein